MTIWNVFQQKEGDDRKPTTGPSQVGKAAPKRLDGPEEYCFLDPNGVVSETSAWQDAPTSPRSSEHERSNTSGRMGHGKTYVSWLEKYDDILFESDV